MNDCCSNYQNKTFWATDYGPIKKITYTFCPECGNRLQHGIKFTPFKSNMQRSRVVNQIATEELTDWGKALSKHMNDTIDALAMNCFMPEKEIPTTHAAPIKKEEERLFPLCKGENDTGCLYKIIDISGNVIRIFIGDGKPIRRIPIPLMALVAEVREAFRKEDDNA